MKLQYLPVCNAWVFTFGEQLIRMTGNEMFFYERADAVRAAEEHGLEVTKNGTVRLPLPNPQESQPNGH